MTVAKVIQTGKTFDESALVVAGISVSKGDDYEDPANEASLINGAELLEAIKALPNIAVIILPRDGGV